MFKEVVDAFDLDFCQIQLNYVDIEYQAGLEGLYYAAEKGLGVVIMEPLRGGAIADNLPEKVKGIFEGVELERSPVEWSFKWLYDKPEVSIVLSGMSAMEHMIENVNIASRNVEDSLSVWRRNHISRPKIFIMNL